MATSQESTVTLTSVKPVTVLFCCGGWASYCKSECVERRGGTGGGGPGTTGSHPVLSESLCSPFSNWSQRPGGSHGSGWWLVSHSEVMYPAFKSLTVVSREEKMSFEMKRNSPAFTRITALSQGAGNTNLRFLRWQMHLAEIMTAGTLPLLFTHEGRVSAPTFLFWKYWWDMICERS